jgi:hypothetical protein
MIQDIGRLSPPMRSSKSRPVLICRRRDWNFVICCRVRVPGGSLTLRRFPLLIRSALTEETGKLRSGSGLSCYRQVMAA